jgi:hypothetical protein
MKLRLLAASLATASTFSFGSATTPDYTDLWYNPAESGWGANVVQQGTTMFITLFVYGPTGQPTWFVASDVRQSGDATSGTFTGTLYQASGPYFVGTFNSANVAATPVGTVTFNASGVSTASLTYTVNGTSVAKTVQRQSFGTDNFTGSYLGGSMGTWSACGARSGYVESGATLTVTQDGSAVTMREDGSNYTCTYTAQLGSSGRFGTLAGNGLCSDGVNFTFTATEMTASRDAFGLRLVLNQVGGCHFEGRMGGVRKGPL